ncbi:hypothetical protein AJ80_02173 [Polytolypa hystricis UAMH7299]|uniref:Endonuclease/exonuclease/phosphatase domain-containing protein n=1 Tax=Polytolypa hystricis (strain UAMH7299) TaxID=1447883 RepID=A0A2B7YI26_POLH7|nr:hypothetical protein AJ80_02173 [Polytolypa hystricis UAMH7299]
MKTNGTLNIRVLTHNIRYATSSPFRGEKPWADRRQRLINELLYHSRQNPMIFICLQEVLHSQLEDILSGLNAEGGEEWAYIGVGRNDGKEAGEYSPIFYRPAVWIQEAWDTVWLSETPSIPSKGWDAASTRIVTIGVFKHQLSRQRVLGMSTHLDDQGSKSRYEAAGLILQQVDNYLHRGEFGGQIAGNFLAGDFNSEEFQEAYTKLTSSNSPLVDTLKQVDSVLQYGNVNTYTGFGYENEPPKRIDYVLVGPRNESGLPWKVQGYAVLPNVFDDGVMLSDHRAVVADVELR